MITRFTSVFESLAINTRERLWGRIKSPYVLAMLLCALLLALRNPIPLLRPEFWAEDAPEFFVGALSMGVKSLWTPVYGYHFFLSRVIALLANAFSVVWAPYFYAWLTFAIGAGVTGYFARDGFSWILPSARARVALCALLAIGPGTAEGFFNLCNLSSVLTFLGLLLLLEKPFALSRFKLVFLIVLLFSAGQMFLLAPFVAYLGWRTQDRRYFGLLLAFIPVILINAFGNHQVGTQTHLLNYARLWLLPQILLENSVVRLLMLPFLGDHFCGLLMRNFWIFWGAVFLVLAVAVWFARSTRTWTNEYFFPLMLCFFCLVSQYGVVAISRGYAIGQVLRNSGGPAWGLRYSYLPGVVALIFWAAVFYEIWRRAGGRWLRLGPGIGVLLLAAHCVFSWPNIYRRVNVEWPKGAALLQQALDQRRDGTLVKPIQIEPFTWVHPMGWHPVHGRLSVTVGRDGVF
ncbi:hypothetical protein WDW37_04325 [Bdellovibrionota bacterium FG-1]